uniref:Uncharacterized protein n=1 Tax=Anguilla anguilla TaxID=7936 RepID=A0A0E9RHM3_ANGAN
MAIYDLTKIQKNVLM